MTLPSIPGHLRVLLVEDDPDHAELVQGCLDLIERVSTNYRWVATLQDAEACVAAEPFDVVLLDLKLPDSDFGSTVPRMVRASPSVPVVVLTSMNDAELGLRAVQQGAQDYLVKTQLSSELLFRAIRYAIERHRVSTELERMNAELRRFAHMVAHDVRSPLSAIGICFGILKRELDGVMSDRQKALVARSERVVGRVDAMLIGLLQYAEAGGELNREAVDTREIVAEAMQNLAAEVEESGAEISVATLPTLSADRLLLRQVFQNLIGNAIKYRRDVPRVEIAWEKDGGEWRFRVQDNGTGFPPDEAARIFEPFQRAHDAAQYQGSGLGLAFCREVVERHGGRVWAESTPGEGSQFFFTLPAPP